MNADRYKRWEHDGFATFQISLVPHGFPRLKVVSVGAGVRVSWAMIGGTAGRQKRKYGGWP